MSIQSSLAISKCIEVQMDLQPSYISQASINSSNFEDVEHCIKSIIDAGIPQRLRDNYLRSVGKFSETSIKTSTDTTNTPLNTRRKLFQYDFDLDVDMELDIDLNINAQPDLLRQSIEGENWIAKLTPEDMATIGILYGKLAKIEVLDSKYWATVDSLADYTHGLNLTEWTSACETIKKWILPWTNKTRQDLYAAMSDYTRLNGMASIYIDRLNQVRAELIDFSRIGLNTTSVHTELETNLDNLMSEAALTSGSIAFYGSIGVSLFETGQVKDIDHLFYFTSLYMLTDHWLDDPKIKSQNKVAMARKLSDLVERPRLVGDHPVLAVMTDRLLKLIEAIPGSHEVLKDAFYAEMVSGMIQGQNNLSGDTYLKVCEWKGGAMLHSMQAICGVKPDRSGYILGACIQLVDDMHDIDEDIAEGIHTIATYVRKKHGNLDPLLFYTINLLEKLDAKHTIFKPFILGMTMHSVAIIPHFSAELHEYCRPYFPFDRTYDLRGVIYERIIRAMRCR
jgi:hypothetical protein